MSYKVFTSESVCAGHPDKICDQISDAILDELLLKDPNSHTGIETLVTANRVVLAGEVKTKAKANYEAIVRSEIRRLGYTDSRFDFDESVVIENFIHEQSAEIAVGVDSEGAGDQGMMFGYACRETPELMPMPVTLAHTLTQAIDKARESKTLAYLRPDGKAQVSVRYAHDRPVEVIHVTLAVPHDEATKLAVVREEMYESVVEPVLEKYGFTLDRSNLLVNGTGVWHMPGPAIDAGLTGRKIIVDTYGGYARVGGGAFSGKDPTKVDRSGAYAARYLAKNIVAAGLADRVEVGLAYFIGGKRPIMAEFNAFGTAKVSEHEIADYIGTKMDLSVTGIIKQLDLTKPIYRNTAAYGHFGRADFPWENAGVASSNAPIKNYKDSEIKR